MISRVPRSLMPLVFRVTDVSWTDTATPPVTAAGPHQEPVTPAQYAGILRVGTVLDSEAVETKLQAARESCELFLSRCFMKRKLEARADFQNWATGWQGFPGPVSSSMASIWYPQWLEEPIHIPRPPCLSVEKISFWQSDGTEVIVDPSVYRVSQLMDPATITLREFKQWPSTTGRTFDAFSITFYAGVEDPADLPSSIVLAVLETAAAMGTIQKGADIPNVSASIPERAQDLLKRFIHYEL